MPTSTLKPEERNARIFALLRQVDENVKKLDLDKALDLIRKIYGYDIKNIYARAYEERILVMMVEKEREAIVRDAEKKATEKIDQEVKRRLNDFYHQQELESKMRKTEEKEEQALEERARKASVNEVKEVTHNDIAAIEKETAKRIDELEKKFMGQIQQVTSIGNLTSASSEVEQVRAEYETKLQQYKKQIQEAESERKKIQEEAFLKMKDEQKHVQEKLMEQMEKERDAIYKREQEKAKQQELETYRNIMKLMVQLAVPVEIQSSLLQALKISFSISDTEHREIERIVELSAYIDAVRKLWDLGLNPTEDDLVHLKNLQQFYHISDDEHNSITEGVKKELALGMGKAVILVIDDDVAVRKYVEHLLKKTYQKVITATNAESIIPEIQKSPPSLIISDINLGSGVMSGFTFYEKILAGTYGEHLKSIPYVLMSSLGDEFFIRSAKQLGVKAYLSKPFTRETLEAVVKNALG
jgi:CheY-like chemotaxis protein